MKETKTNAMRILDSNKINYTVHSYESDEFIDGVHTANLLGIDSNRCFKTLVTVGKNLNYYVFVIPVALELDMKKAAKSVNEKSVEMLHVKDINDITGYIRGGCSPIGMKKLFKTVIDISAENYETVYVSGGRINTQIQLSPADLLKVTKGKFEPLIREELSD
jgi:Cys-tRNA(Pro)/Cys-tRNA(Cys) deacylase